MANSNRKFRPGNNLQSGGPGALPGSVLYFWLHALEPGGLNQTNCHSTNSVWQGKVNKIYREDRLHRVGYTRCCATNPHVLQMFMCASLAILQVARGDDGTRGPRPNS